MKHIIVGLVSAATFSLAACSGVPSIANEDPPALTGQDQWSDADDAHPNYPTDSDARDLMGWAWSQYTAADRATACQIFWDVSDDQMVDVMIGKGYTDSEINAWLNILWDQC